MNARMEGRATLVWRGLVCVVVDGGVFEVETRSGWGQDGMGWDENRMEERRSKKVG